MDATDAILLLREQLTKLVSHVEIKPESLHPFGEVNFERERRKFSDAALHIRSLVLQYQKWQQQQGGDDTALKRYLKASDENSLYQSHLKRLRKSLGDGRTKLHEVPSGSVPSADSRTNGSTLRTLLDKLAVLAKSLGLEYMEDLPPELPEGATPTQSGDLAPVILSSQYFLLDVHIVPQLHVKLTYTFAEEQHSYPEIDEELSVALRDPEFAVFEAKMTCICEKDKFIKEFPSGDQLRKSMQVMESGLVEIHEREVGVLKGMGIETKDLSSQILSQGHGKVSRTVAGIRIEYYVSPLYSLIGRGSLVGKSPSVLAANVGIEETSLPASRFPLDATFSFEENCTELPLKFRVEDSTSTAPPHGVTCVLRLDPPLLMGKFTAQQLHDLSFNSEQLNYPAPADDAYVASSTSLRNLILGTVASNDTVEHPSESGGYERQLAGGLSEEMEYFAEIQSCAYRVLTTDYNCAGVVLTRVPFRNAGDLHPILQLLKKQAAFNELYTSCITGSRKEPDTAAISMIEVGAESPNSLSVTVVHPLSSNLLALQISVLMGGSLTCTFQAAPNDPTPCSDAYAGAVLMACRSIPIAIHHILHNVKNRRTN